MNQSPRLPIARKVSPGATRKEITILFVIAQNRVSLLKINRPQFNMLAYVSLNLNPWGPRFALLAKYLLISEAFLLKQNLNLIRFSRCWQTLELAVLAVVFSTARQSLLRGPSLKRGSTTYASREQNPPQRSESQKAGLTLKWRLPSKPQLSMPTPRRSPTKAKTLQ